MYQLLAQKMWVNEMTSAPRHVSPAIPMGSFNAVQVELTVFASSGGQLVQIVLQGSNDRENWFTLSSQGPFDVGYRLLTAVSGISAQFVRVKASMSDVSEGIIAFGMNQTRL